MGALSSKSKSANVTLHRKSSNSDNGATNLRCQDDSNDAIPIASTPSKEKILPFDPRSPAESFDRTPITVCSNSRDVDTPLAHSAVAVKVLDIDPRSPSQQVSRTPIVVESAATPSSIYKRLQQHKESTPFSSRAANSQRSVIPTDDDDATSLSTVFPKTSLANICTSTKSDICYDSTDPRSPTVTVPRTPLEDKQFEVSGSSRDLCDGITKRLLFNQSACDSAKFDEETCELQDMEPNAVDDSTMDREDEGDGEYSSNAKDTTSNSKQRKPLASVQNGGGRGTPRALLQAKQCRTLEEEFSKNQRNILSQLVQDDAENIAPVPSTTQFVEEI